MLHSSGPRAPGAGKGLNSGVCTLVLVLLPFTVVMGSGTLRCAASTVHPRAREVAEHPVRVTVDELCPNFRVVGHWHALPQTLLPGVAAGVARHAGHGPYR